MTSEGSPSTSRIWKPGPRALETAKSVVKIIDIPIHITRYAVVKAEKRQQPNDAEWLRWILADEEKAKALLRKEEAEKRRGRSWYDVAD